ncbi:hypothetical protein MMC31_008071, partial [Peltigera leucophlebia]|nr:hypothetical protein [Peltigera leucophlebia]
STTRSGKKGFNVTNAHGRHYPTDACLIWLIPHAIQRDPAFWPEADKLIPPPWLVAPGDPFYPREEYMEDHLSMAVTGLHWN